MLELVPYQEKRKKKFAENVTPEQAVASEFKAFFAKLKDKTALDANLFAKGFAPITSPTVINDGKHSWTTTRLTQPLVLLIQTQKLFTAANIPFPRRRYLFLPKPYQKMLKTVLTSKNTFEKLAKVLKSNKKAKRIIRILHKRYGIYTKKKVKLIRKEN